MSAALITTHRYNWMGHYGTETEEIDTAHLRGAGHTADNYDYEHRQQVIADIKERLHRVKRDLDLISEEEMRAEQEARQRRQAERRRREEEERQRQEEEAARRAEEEERRRIEKEQREQEEAARRAEEEERRRQAEKVEQERASRWRQINDSDADSDDEEEINALLSGMRRTQKEIDNAVRGFTAGSRALIVSNDGGYVSYLDGSVHLTKAKLQQHNEAHRPGVEKAMEAANMPVPSAEEYALDEVSAAEAERDVARKKLDAYRVNQDPAYAVRIRSSEKDAAGKPTTELTAEDGDEAALTEKVVSTKQKAAEIRKAYNDRAGKSGRTIASVVCSSAAHPDEAAGNEASAPPPEEDEL